MPIEKEFKINKYLEMKLVSGKTFIYVNGRRFMQCIRLILDIPKIDIERYEEINSIDEAVEEYNKYLYQNKIIEGDNLTKQLNEPHSITPEQEFWGHCSNLQIWAENNYDSRLLRNNLAFPLLKILSDIGDPVAKKVFAEEVMKRFESRHESVVKFLLENRYLLYLKEKQRERLLNKLLLNFFKHGNLKNLNLALPYLKSINVSKFEPFFNDIDSKFSKALTKSLNLDKDFQIVALSILDKFSQLGSIVARKIFKNFILKKLRLGDFSALHYFFMNFSKYLHNLDDNEFQALVYNTNPHIQEEILSELLAKVNIPSSRKSYLEILDRILTLHPKKSSDRSD